MMNKINDKGCNVNKKLIIMQCEMNMSSVFENGILRIIENNVDFTNDEKRKKNERH